MQAPERAQCGMEQNSEPEQSSSLCRSTFAPTEGCGPGALSPFLLLSPVNGREAARWEAARYEAGSLGFEGPPVYLPAVFLS